MELERFERRIEKDFVPRNFSEDWRKRLEPVSELVEDRFLEKGYGTVFRNSEKTSKVYTSVFPSEKVIKEILEEIDGGKGAILFTHHPVSWDITEEPVFKPLRENLLEDMEEKSLSLYSLHGPLDNYGQYSTSTVLAQVLGLMPEKSFAEGNGVKNGVICQKGPETVEELEDTFRNAVEHEVDVRAYGGRRIEKVGVVAGGGLQKKFLEEMVEEGVKTLVTGVTRRNEFTEEVHRFAEENGINVLGGTHYSTEKFAMQKLCGYLENLMLDTDFIPGEPGMGDIE